MRGLRKRFVKGIFIATEVIFVTDGTSFDCHLVASLKAGARAVFTLRYFHINRSIDNANYMAQKLAAHLLGKVDQGRALLRGGSPVNQQHRFGRIWLAIRIAQRGLCLDGANDSQAVKRDAVPLAFANMPGAACLPPGSIHLAISKALPDVHVSAAGFKILAFDLWCNAGGRSRRLSTKRSNRKNQSNNQSRCKLAIHRKTPNIHYSCGRGEN